MNNEPNSIDSDIICKLKELTTNEHMIDSINVASTEASQDADWNRSIIFALYNSSSYRIASIKDNLIRAWKLEGRVDIVEVSSSRGIAWFKNQEDRDRILLQGPWSFINELVVMLPGKRNTLIDEYELHSANFWVQLHGLPIESHTRGIIEKLAGTIGPVQDVMMPASPLQSYNFVRAKVTLDLRKPLKSTIQMHYCDTERIISFKYERLPKFCLYCGRIGHQATLCTDRAIVREQINRLSTASLKESHLHLLSDRFTLDICAKNSSLKSKFQILNPPNAPVQPEIDGSGQDPAVSRRSSEKHKSISRKGKDSLFTDPQMAAVSTQLSLSERQHLEQRLVPSATVKIVEHQSKNTTSAVFLSLHTGNATEKKELQTLDVLIDKDLVADLSEKEKKIRRETDHTIEDLGLPPLDIQDSTRSSVCSPVTNKPTSAKKSPTKKVGAIMITSPLSKTLLPISALKGKVSQDKVAHSKRYVLSPSKKITKPIRVSPNQKRETKATGNWNADGPYSIREGKRNRLEDSPMKAVKRIKFSSPEDVQLPKEGCTDYL